MNLAFIVCDHGLGHLRRVCIFASSLIRQNNTVTLFASHSDYILLTRSLTNISGLTIVDFSTNTSPNLYFESSLDNIIGWIHDLPSLDYFDIIFSDNLPEVLLLYPNCILIAQFFWHDVIPTCNRTYVELCNRLLQVHNPIILSDHIFAMPIVRQQTNFIPSNHFFNPDLISAHLSSSPSIRTNLLITGGSTQLLRPQFMNIVETYKENKPTDYHTIFLDPNLYHSGLPSWFSLADFTIGMFCTLRHAICRPGLGIITDLLTVSVLPDTIVDNDNLEMLHNATCIEHLKKLRQ